MVSEIGDLERNPAGWPPDEVPPRRGAGGLDSGFHSVDSGSKRWSVNESVDELMDRMEDVTRDSRQQRVGSGESAGKPAHPNPEPGDCVQGGTEEGERGKIPPTNEEDSGTEKPGSQPHLIAERNTRWSGDGPRRETEERRKPGTLLIWQERERQLRSQGERRVLSSNPASRPVSCSFPEPGGKTPASELVPTGVVSIPRHKIDDVQVVGVSRLPAKRPDQPLVSPTREPGNVQRPQSFLFRTSTRPNLKRSGSGSSSPLSPTFPSDPMNPNGIGTPEPETLSVSQLRQELESRLRRRFPDDLGEALTDGVALCQLLNLLRPRSISVIYVPSPAVPKLTLSKRRKNVESFLDGCQRIGVPQDAMCEARQILEDESLVRVCRMVGALLDITRGKASKPPTQG
uniref:Leucine-rich repeat neuronal protein 4 n=1 Tax=Callorhinchus milii TaxID=7868 RepID=V9KUX8_CALMI